MPLKEGKSLKAELSKTQQLAQSLPQLKQQLANVQSQTYIFQKGMPFLRGDVGSVLR